jgi:hypothetical protein
MTQRRRSAVGVLTVGPEATRVTQSNNGRRIVPPATDAMLLAGGERIHADLQGLLRSF